MRELTFAIEYEHGADPVMDVFIEHPRASAHSLDAVVDEDAFWRMEHATGPGAALDDLEAVRFDDDACGEAITDRRCVAARHHDVVERTTNELVLYSYLADICECESVHTLAGAHLPGGLIFETRRRESTCWWRVLMRSDEKIGIFYDELGARLRDGLSFRMGHLQDATEWRRDELTGVALPDEQADALHAAVNAGYYDPPRETTLDEIATDLEIPRSTLSYRLRQAESKLVHLYVDGETGTQWLE
ncbi:helix-turn-helix domain-containing protein [Halobacterium sp. KA-4]|uniref:helix-turn-helix domain-containing protein n=1 Tax=Halobacteriaceae TaxID=2236 RepID=UPI001B3AEFEF|nr:MULTISPECIES: helix-turn-helix domain-containing protein [Halobacteriaceae]MBP2252342.1 putative DNA binding protein [Halarchaeum solikamskense]MCD2201262.1 helix-turn-helix domain-containing protein [Halobacterium sp. KA-4]